MAAVAGPNPANRQAMTVMMTRLGTVIALITAFIPTLVTKLQFGKWNYFVIATVFMLPMPWAFGAIAKLAEGKDLPVGAGGQVHQITPADMIGALTENKMLLALFVTNTILNISTNITSGIGSYYWIYVAGNFSLMTIASLVGSVAGFFAAMIMPKLGQKLGKKRAISIGYFIGPCVNLIVGILGRYSWYYVIAGRIVSTFIMYAYSPFVMLLYMDAGEYHFNKTGKDTRGIVMGLSTPPMKIAMAVGGTVGLWLLGRTGYEAGFTPTSQWVNDYMAACYLIPAAIGFVAAALFALLYRLSDEEAATAAAENFKKLQADRAAMAAKAEEK
jgi:Na+/melibiose symporter-like transporter